MPGTGDVTYVLGPGLVALALGVLIVVTVRTLRRGPTVAARSAPDHGLPQRVRDMSEADPPGSDIPAPRDPQDRQVVTRAANGRHLFVRPPAGASVRPRTRRAPGRR